ncbi:MAG: GNAT family N-acetyltransferase [Clostridia bacterium]|nr:GNAT family N-acetyltransferase [Clostridia bacterium]
MIEYTLRKYQDEDYEFVYEIKKICYKKYVDEYYGGWDEDKQREMFADLMKEDSKHSYVIIADNKKIGFFSEGEDTEEVYRPNNLCLLPEYRGKGIGSNILNKAFDKHKEQDIYLKVFKSNPAKNLYQRLGFDICDETKSHYLMVRKKEQ